MLNCFEAGNERLLGPFPMVPCEQDGGMSDKAEEVKQSIKRIREERGLSLRKMAQRLGINPGTYHRIESGDGGLKIDRIFEIAEILEVDPAVFLGTHQPDFAKVWSLFQQLSPELRERALQHMDLLALAAQASPQGKPQ